MFLLLVELSFHNLICLLPSLSTAAVPCVSSQSSPSSTAPQPHPPTLPGELCSLYTPSRLGVYMYTILLLVLLCVLSVYPSLSPSPPPLTPQLSLHPLHHFHVPVVQSLLSLSLLLQLVSLCVCVCVCLSEFTYIHLSLISFPSL